MQAKLIPIEEAAELLAVSTRTLWGWTRSDSVPHHRLGRLIRFDPAELQAWLDAGAPTEPGSGARLRKEARR